MRNSYALSAAIIRQIKEVIFSVVVSPIVTADIGDGQVTYPKIQDVSTASKLLGRGDSGSGDVQELTLGTNLNITGTTINASGSGTSAWGDITGTLSNQTDLQTELDSKLESPIAIADVTGLQTSLDSKAVYPVLTANISNDQVTYAKVQNVSAASRLLGRGSAAGAGDPEEITLGTNLSLSGTTLNATGGGGGSATNVEVNLGSTLRTQGRFIITDAAIGPTSKVVICQASGPYTGKGTRADEAEMDILQCIAYAGSGSAIIYYKVLGYVAFTPDRWARIDRNQITLASAVNTADDFRTRYCAKPVGRVRGNVKFNYSVY